MNRFLCLLVLVGGTAAAASDVPELTKLPKHQTPVPCFHIRNWHITHNLGPTGARGWIYGYRGDTSESREILVKSVEPGSPADGVLQPYDIITGVAGADGTGALKPFDSDARLAMARAITRAEGAQGGGELKLLRNRDGESSTVVVKLRELGDYASTAPFDCSKTDRIVREAADFVAKQMPVDGFRAGVPDPLNAAFLLATENPAYLDHVRRSAVRMSLNHTISDAGHETWRWGNTNLFLCEYYLATGDRRVLPTIEEYCKVLAEGQCNPGTWGHRAVPDFIPPGYGSLNSSGVVCFLSMVLGNQCGVKVDQKALSNSIGFYGSFAGRGGIPYGDHPPSDNSSSNGKNGMAAVAFHQLGAKPASQWFARMACSSHLLAFEGGHTGNYFNQTWTPLGASLAGRENYANFWSRFNGYRDLARRWDGSFIAQPYPHLREGDLGTGNYVQKGPMWSTGPYALSYLADSKRLAILGRTRSIFSPGAPAGLKPALDLYHAKRFVEAAAEAAKVAGDADLQPYADQLIRIAGRNADSVALTLADMGKALELGDLYKLKWQLQAIESVVNADDPRLEPFRKAVMDPANEAVLASGATYHGAAGSLSYVGPRGFRMVAASGQADRRRRGDLTNLTNRGAGSYREAAAAYLETHPKLVAAPDTVLLPKPPTKRGEQAEGWKRAIDRPASGWMEPDFDAAGWEPVPVPVQVDGAWKLRGDFEVVDPARIEMLSAKFETPAAMKVFLNGTLILDIEPQGGRGHDGEILLKPLTRELLKSGGNALAVELVGGSKDRAFHFELKAVVEGAGS